MSVPLPLPSGEGGLHELCGVRTVRGGPVQLVAAAGQGLEPGQLVVIATHAGEILATVAIGTGQVMENEGSAAPVGHVIRIAGPADLLTFGRRAAEAAAIRVQAEDRCIAAGAAIVDAWLAPDASWATIVLAGAIPGADVLARELTALIGMGITLRARRGAGDDEALSGVAGAGIPPGWADWLVPPGDGPVLRREPDPAASPLAGELIARLFPATDNWPPPRPRRRRP